MVFGTNSTSNAIKVVRGKAECYHECYEYCDCLCYYLFIVYQPPPFLWALYSLLLVFYVFG